MNIRNHQIRKRGAQGPQYLGKKICGGEKKKGQHTIIGIPSGGGCVKKINGQKKRTLCGMPETNYDRRKGGRSKEVDGRGHGRSLKNKKGGLGEGIVWVKNGADRARRGKDCLKGDKKNMKRKAAA